MKFKDLPEGYYCTHAIRKTVYVQAIENIDDDPYAGTKVVHDGRQYRKYGRTLNDGGSPKIL